MSFQNLDQSTDTTDTSGLIDQITRLQQVSNHLINARNAGIGSTLPLSIQSGIQVPPVQSLGVQVLGLTGSSTRIAVTWVAPVRSTRFNIDHFNVYVNGLYTQQKEALLVASVHTSPCVVAILPDGANSIRVFVQTVLDNGHVLPIDQCPTTAFTSLFPSPFVVYAGMTPTAPWSNTGAPWYNSSSSITSSSTLQLAGALTTTAYADATQAAQIASTFPAHDIAGAAVLLDNTAAVWVPGIWHIDTAGKLYVHSGVTAGHNATLYLDGISARYL